MQSGPVSTQGSWFRSTAGRLYGRHFAGMIIAKIVLLAILYFVFVATAPRADTSADAIARRILDTSDIPHADR
jgi:uncharacterized membrane protein